MIESAGFRSEMIARARIAENLAGAEFALLWAKTPALQTLAERRKFAQKQPSLDTPVAVVGSKLQERGVPSWLRLSRDGIGHIKASGREITPEQMRLVQKAVDGENTYFQHDKVGGRWVSYIEADDGQWWAVAWKVTADGSRGYLMTMMQSSQRKMEHAKRRYGKQE